MSKRSNRPEDDLDESLLFSDPDFELEAFVEFMAMGRSDHEERTPRQKVDDRNELKWLRDQLDDWDDGYPDDWDDGYHRDEWCPAEEIEWH